VVGAVIVVLMVTLGRRSAQVFVITLGMLLVGYALFGRGVAYVGTGSLFIGEAVLFLGVLAFLLNIGRARVGPLQLLLVAFVALGLMQTIPYLGSYGLVALRDGVVWGYALFALAVATTFDRRWLEPLVGAYRWLIPAFLLWIPIATALDIGFRDSLPTWPGAPVPFVTVKQGDFAVQLAGIAAFILAGLHAERRGRIPTGIIWALLFLDLAIVGAVSRGGLLAAAVGMAGALLFVRSAQRLLTATGIALAGFILLYTLNPTIDVGSSQGRTLSFNQLVANVASVILESDSGNLQGTKEWRLAWWERIVDYTVDGPYFWTGKGFGINLADDDGFQVLADRSLRAPHNGHIAILARGGVPLLALWILIQAAFGVGLLRAARRARAAGQPTLVRLAAWVFAFWSAALVNMTFDVYLEGPQGGIWFWSAIGIGLVIMDAARRAGDASQAGPRDVVEPGRTSQAARRHLRSTLAAGFPEVGPFARPVTIEQPSHRPRRETGDTAPDHLLLPPTTVDSTADDFFGGLIRRIEGDR
jgi:hypothetical protein